MPRFDAATAIVVDPARPKEIAERFTRIGLQRASGGRRGQANYRGAWTDAEHERLSATCSPGRCRPGPPRTQGREISVGYCNEDNLLALATRKIHAYVATGRAQHPAETTRKVGGEMTQKMRQKLKRAGYRSRYRLRKQIVEPVFGQIKQARGFRQFLLRGLEAVQAEWALICTTHNITKLAKAV